ncbi:tripartite tricarboxylate transporter substrate binding protein [Oleomonas cavernae]|uniref:Tripartite tricarboxylate transporter substrate binding protein n=1 Tax=Oleomonas cavernae TaxID=2320859 RepID=A0A418WD98_9PROT|nr:tripartite tricarboxylate transporter substrate binding protein [Oleomonas cavernae]RJF88002.1 tripartite tricarboxylate transporter substrate binding protein [Oleomonas cavernae]
MPRIKFLRHVAVALAALVVGLGGPLASARAESLPELTVMAPAKPGGGWDQTARVLQEVLLATGAAKTVTVENVAGAGGTIGLAQFAGKKGSGDALMVGGLVMVGAVLTNQSPVTLKDVTPIARLTGEFEVIVVPAASPFKTMADLVAAFKADPGKTTWAGGSAGGTDQILVGLIAKAVGADPTSVNYIAYSGGGEALAALLGNKVSAGVSGYGEFAGQIASGELRALAISSPERVASINIPTLREQGVAVDLANWRAVFAPPGIDAAQRTALIAAIDTVHKSTQWQDVLKKRDWTDLYLSGDDFDKFLGEEVARVETTLREIGLVQ